MPSDFSADPLVSSMLRTSRRRVSDEIAGPQPPPLWRDRSAPTAAGASLAELCEPLFLFICRLNRAGRLGVPPEVDISHSAARVRAEVLRMLQSTAALAAARDGRGGSAFARVQRPLELFVDDLMSRRFTAADNAWLPLAEIGPGFFSLLDLALVETDAGAADRLTVFYICLTLGFRGSGPDAGRPLDAYLAKLSARLGGRMDADDTAPICPDAYQHTDRRPLSEPVGAKLALLLVATAALVLVMLIVDGTLYVAPGGSIRHMYDHLLHALPRHSTVAPPGAAQGEAR